MSENKLYKIMADLLYEANTLSAVQVVLRSLDDNVDQINQRIEHSAFFAVVKETCLQCLYLSTVKIFDTSKHNESSSLKSLKKTLFLDADQDKATEIIDTIDDFLNDHDIAGTLDRIREIRHQFIAHKQTEAQLEARDITMNDFYGHIDKTFELLNEIADRIGFHGNQRITRGDEVKSSIQSLFYALSAGR